MKTLRTLPLILTFLLITSCGQSTQSTGSSAIHEDDFSSSVAESNSEAETEATLSQYSLVESLDDPSEPDSEDVPLLEAFHFAIANSLKDSYGDNYSVSDDYVTKEITVSMWSSGIADLSESAASGNPESAKRWQDFSSSFIDLNTAFCEIADMLGLNEYAIQCDYLSDLDLQSVLISASNKQIIYDCVPSTVITAALDEADEYAYASDEVKYTAAKDAFDSYVSSHEGAIGDATLNFNFTPNNHPYLSAVINFSSPYDSIYDFQSLVCDTLDSISSIANQYYVQFDNISVYYRIDDTYIEYRPHEMDDIYIGFITDEYNGVTGYDIPADEINDWYAGDDFSEKAAEADAPCTYDEYLSISTGMSYNEVVDIIGSDGTELSSVSISGNTSSVYQWEGSKKYSNVVVEFSNGKVISKAQSGLN